jgi:hypothetical protein
LKELCSFECGEILGQMAAPEVVDALGAYFDIDTSKLNVEREVPEEDTSEISVIGERVPECLAAVVHYDPGP